MLFAHALWTQHVSPSPQQPRPSYIVAGPFTNNEPFLPFARLNLETEQQTNRR